MRALCWGLAVWSTAFFALELPAHYGLVPWPTLSRTVWIGIKDWHPVAYFVALFVAILLGHFEFRWSAGWLIAIAAAGSLAITVHILTR